MKFMLHRKRKLPDLQNYMTLLGFQEGEYNTVPAVTTSVSICKSPLEQNQTKAGWNQMSLAPTSSNLVWDEEARTPVLLSQWAGSISSSQLVPRCSESLAKLNQCRSICWYQLRSLQYSGREQQTVSKRGGNRQLSCPVAKPFVSSRKRKSQSWEPLLLA